MSPATGRLPQRFPQAVSRQSENGHVGELAGLDCWRETESTTCLQPSTLGGCGSGYSPYRQVGQHIANPGRLGRD
jgi:hypothetical protein